MLHIFRRAIDVFASDIHLSVNQKPRLRIHGVLTNLSDEPIVTGPAMEKLLESIFSSEQKFVLDTTLESHRSYEYEGVRFRVNAFYENGKPAIVARLIQSRIPTPEEIGLPPSVLELACADRGLILLTGPTGSGKSTTLASVIEWINTRTARNIVTLEDPVEYVFESKKSLIKQREVGRDIPSFHESLKGIVRHDPDVVMVGEMRDVETMRAAITLAETGHLVLSTLHTSSAAQTLNRIIDSFPALEHAQIRSQLGLSLRGIIAQKLVASRTGERLAVREILINTPAIAHLIREHKLEQIASIMQISADVGMTTAASALEALYTDGKISHDTYQENTR